MTGATLFPSLVGPKPAIAPRLGDLIWLAFVLAQVADGSLTYVGLKTFGTAVEANPLLGWSIAAAGGTLAIIGAKMFALACGAVLHLRAMHRVIAILTAVYVAASVWPWSIVLWPSL